MKKQLLILGLLMAPALTCKASDNSTERRGSTDPLIGIVECLAHMEGTSAEEKKALFHDNVEVFYQKFKEALAIEKPSLQDFTFNQMLVCFFSRDLRDPRSGPFNKQREALKRCLILTLYFMDCESELLIPYPSIHRDVSCYRLEEWVDQYLTPLAGDHATALLPPPSLGTSVAGYCSSETTRTDSDDILESGSEASWTSH